jgi:hypothetical protein
MSPTTNLWFPLFEFQDYIYQSFLVLPTEQENEAPAGSAVTAKKWGKGAFSCGQAMRSADGYELQGSLVFRPGVELPMTAKGALGEGSNPASFEATSLGTEGPTKGAVHILSGWVFPDEPIQNGAARVLRSQGVILAVRGPDTSPAVALGGGVAGTSVGTFLITRTPLNRQ